MSNSALFDNFEVSETGIRPLRDDIPREVFLAAAREYLSIIRHNGFKLGDLLHEFRERFPDEVQHYLIPNLIATERQNHSNLNMQMSLAKSFSQAERFEDIDQTHYREAQAVQDTAPRREILDYVRTERAAGNAINAQTVRNMARDAKLATGQGIRSNRGKPRIEV